PELDPDNPANHRSSAGWTAIGADVYAPITATPAVADLDGDGALEVVVATFRGMVHVFSSDGSVWPGFPVASEPVTYTDEDDSLADSFFSSPALGDIDGDGALEIVLGAGDQQLYAWEIDGSYTPGFPVRLAWPDEVLDRRRIVASPAIGDIDGDGRDDIVIGTNETVTEEHAALYAVDGRGQVMPGWPIRLYGLFVDVLPMVGQGVPNSAALVDLDGDGVVEVVTHGLAGDVEIVHGDGTDFFKTKSALSVYGAGSNVSDTTIFPLINSPSIGDLDGDGVPDIVNGAAGFDYARGTEEDGVRHDFDHALGGWSGVTGDFLPGFPRMVEDLQFFANPAVVDIDGDRRMEAITGSGGFIVHAWNADGEQPVGWPKLTGQWVIASPAVGDIDGDGTIEVVVGTREGYLFAWHTGTEAGADAGWVRFGHDNRNTHNYEVPLDGWNTWMDDPDAGIDDECGCSAGVSTPGGVAILGLLLARRRPTAA
ncbi:MAG: VCBS repeat-containing protein, partial [Deltaproteobacteria bacterium]|nr:VCBS repeat-containing protein [Deltaproteobacteria bacterium]